MDEIDWRAAYDDIVRLLASTHSLLEANDVMYVKHYLAVGEYEMALEILCLDVMHRPEVRLAHLEELGALAKRLGLDQESVYDADFWKNFTAALEARRRLGSP